MDLKELWNRKYAAGLVRHDPDMLVVRPASANSHAAWGTVYYSAAREKYKSEVRGRRRTTFDPELMRQLHLGEHGGLSIAANPNSLFAGHLVIYPRAKAPELTTQDLQDISDLAAAQPEYTFIHNMERSAASIVDWAHFQAYPGGFPIEDEAVERIHDSATVNLGRLAANFPAHVLVAESVETGVIANWLSSILELLQRPGNPHGRRIPVNFIWKNSKVWVVPRAKYQSELAASYFGGLEMGGIFCLPSASEFGSYLPEMLQAEIYRSSLASEPGTREWFDANALRLLEECL